MSSSHMQIYIYSHRNLRLILLSLSRNEFPVWSLLESKKANSLSICGWKFLFEYIILWNWFYHRDQKWCVKVPLLNTWNLKLKKDDNKKRVSRNVSARVSISKICVQRQRHIWNSILIWILAFSIVRPCTKWVSCHNMMMTCVCVQSLNQMA